MPEELPTPEKSLKQLEKENNKSLKNNQKYNEPINISTKNGNAVVLSEEDYNNLIETLYISSMPKLKEELIKRKNSSDKDFVKENEVDW